MRALIVAFVLYMTAMFLFGVLVGEAQQAPPAPDNYIMECVDNAAFTQPICFAYCGPRPDSGEVIDDERGPE